MKLHGGVVYSSIASLPPTPFLPYLPPESWHSVRKKLPTVSTRRGEVRVLHEVQRTPEDEQANLLAKLAGEVQDVKRSAAVAE